MRKLLEILGNSNSSRKLNLHFAVQINIRNMYLARFAQPINFEATLVFAKYYVETFESVRCVTGQNSHDH